MSVLKTRKTGWFSTLLVFTVLAVIGGCGKDRSKSEASGKKQEGAAAQVVSSSSSGSVPQAPRTGEYRVIQVENGGTLRGAVRYAGTAPARARLAVDHDQEACALHDIFSEELVASADGKVQNAVVWLQGVGEGKAWSENEVVLNQEGCVYLPHVVAVGVGHPLKFVNSDPVIHNVNTFPRENPPLNVSLLAKGMGRPVSRTLKLPDEIKVTCDAHKWMSAWIIVRDNPYFSVTGNDGAYVIEDIPPGTYTMTTWHESLGRVERTVQLAAREARSEDVELKAR